MSCGYDIRGNQVRKTMTWTPNPDMTEKQIEKELARQIVFFEDSVKAGSSCGSSNVKFEKLAEDWLRQIEIENNLKPLTIDKYKKMRERVYKALGHMKIKDIKRAHIQKFINSLAEDGVNKLTGGGLSTKSQKGYLGFISDVFKYAIVNDIVAQNPCRNISTVKTEKKERVIFTLDESKRFLELLEKEETRFKLMFTLALYSGLRHGELLGLQWDDVDFENHIIYIKRVAVYTQEKGHFFGKPKTKTSERCLKLPNFLIDQLRIYKYEQSAYKLLLGDRWEENNLIFPNDFGGIMHQSISRRWLKNFCKENELPNVSVHGLRHMNASLLISSGADIKTVSAVLGHSQTSTTLDIYAHSFAKQQAMASDAVADILSGKKDK